MIGLCLVLLLGGAEPSVQPAPAPDPAELRIHQAMVVPADAFEVDAPEDPAPKADADLAGDMPLRKATVLPTPEPSKEP